MGKYRTFFAALAGSALLTFASTSQALTLTPKQQQHLAVLTSAGGELKIK